MHVYEQLFTIDDYQLPAYAEEAGSIGLSVREYTELTLLNGLRIATAWMNNSGFNIIGAPNMPHSTKQTKLIVHVRSNPTSEVYSILYAKPPVNSAADAVPQELAIATPPRTTINVNPDMVDRTALMAGMLNAGIGAYLSWARTSQSFVTKAMRIGKDVRITTTEGVQKLTDIL